MRGKPTSRAGGLVLVLAWLAAVLAGGVAPAAAPLDPALVAFLAAGGSLDDLCGDDGHGNGAAERHCDACRLFDPPLLPAPPGPFAARSRPLGAAAAPVVEAAAVPSPLRPGAPRAPPPWS